LQTPYPERGRPEYDVPLLYPGRAKLSSLAEEPYATAYGALERLADTHSVWVVIGYSFRDTGIERVAERAAMRQKMVRLIAVNPDEGLTCPRECRTVWRHITAKFETQEGLDRTMAEAREALGIPAP